MPVTVRTLIHTCSCTMCPRGKQRLQLRDVLAPGSVRSVFSAAALAAPQVSSKRPQLAGLLTGRSLHLVWYDNGASIFGDLFLSGDIICMLAFASILKSQTEHYDITTAIWFFIAADMLVLVQSFFAYLTNLRCFPEHKTTETCLSTFKMQMWWTCPGMVVRLMFATLEMSYMSRW